MSQLTFNVQNNSGINADQIFIQFTGTVNATINQAAVVADTWYQVSGITSCTIGATTSGRIYVTYQAPNTTPTFSVTDSILASSSAYTQSFDKIELTFDGTSYGVADLTAIDFWSIPMSLETQQNGVQVGALNGVKSSTGAQDIYDALTALSNPVQSATTANTVIIAFATAGNPLPQGIQDNLTSPASGLITTGGSPAAFVRVIGPNSYPSFGDPTASPVQNPGSPFTPYNTFQPYLQYLYNTFSGAAPSPFTTLGNGIIATIQGQYNGNPSGSGQACQAQAYDFTAAIDQNLNVTISGNGSVVGQTTLQIAALDLLAPASAYGANPVFTLNGVSGQTPQNDLYAWVLGDFFAGLNIGAIGSAALSGNVAVGDLTSAEWFAQLPAIGMFSNLWPSTVTNYWNQWAQVLNPLSDAYNFAYSERFSAPLLSLDPANVDTLILTLLPQPNIS